MKKTIKIALLIILSIFLVVFGIKQYRIFQLKRVLTGSHWYVSNIVKEDNSILEKGMDLESNVFVFNNDNTYKKYHFLSPKLQLASFDYYGNETYKVTLDSLILDDYFRAKINSFSKDSVVITHLQNYNYIDSASYSQTIPLRITIKPIYIQAEPDTFLRRVDRSRSKPTIID